MKDTRCKTQDSNVCRAKKHFKKLAFNLKLICLLTSVAFIVTCAGGNSNSTTSSTPAPILSNDYSFTYNKQESLMLRNFGPVASFNLVSGTYPAGLTLAINNGRLFLQGTPTQVTLTAGEIGAVPLAITAGGSNVTINVTVNPIFVSGDQSPGYVHGNVADADGSTAGIQHSHPAAFLEHAHSGDAANHDHSTVAFSADRPHHDGGNGTSMNASADGSVHRHFRVTHTHDDSGNTNAVIHSPATSAISFASGGTGAYNDPVLVGIAADATSVSFVINLSGVNLLSILGVTQDVITANPNRAYFYIKLLNVSKRFIRSTQIELINFLDASGTKISSGGIIYRGRFFSVNPATFILNRGFSFVSEPPGNNQSTLNSIEILNDFQMFFEAPGTANPMPMGQIRVTFGFSDSDK